MNARLASLGRSDPDQILIAHGDQRHTRAALERHADALAARFRRMGVTRGQTVAVCLPRGVDQIATGLALLKMGAVCLPLSPADPVEMLRFRLADCGVVLLVVQNEHDPIVALAAGAEVLTLGPLQAADTPLPTREAEGTPAYPVAWITPASGVGGATCGAEITHANLLLLADWLAGAWGVRPGDRVCHMADPGSAAAMLELWPCLAAGATLVVVDDATAADPAALRTWLEAEGITVLVAGEDAIEALAQAPLGPAAPLRLVLTDVVRARRYPADPRFRIVATYGHEECTLVSAAHVVGRNERPGGPHLGTAIAGTRIHVLDEAGRPLPRGREGELWIGGAGVGRGYRNRPYLTAERFVPDPFATDPGGMIFRTGRRGRALPGGGIGGCGLAGAW